MTSKYRSLILFSSLARIVNGKFLIKVKHLHRIMLNSCFMLSGFLIISFACTYNQNEASFYLSLLSSVLMGITCALGESTVLGFCKAFPSTIVGFFGSGTGFAGVFGSGIILILKGAGLDDGQIFFAITPAVILYFLAFWWISRIKDKYPYIQSDSDTITMASPPPSIKE
jgi:battenin